MKFAGKILALFLCIALIGALAGCGDKHREAYLYFELKEHPATLDPQTASSDTELLIIRNVFEGLMRYNAEGELVCGAAESYEKKGLTYTFYLRDDAKWSTGDPLTAADFVYGLRRAVSPDTNAPFASRLFSIEGAKEVNSLAADISALGVKAVDAQTVQITLCREDEYFLDTLASSVCMPCNEEFFGECIGKYGLESKYIIANGSYSIRKWAKNENFGIRLYSNKEYNGEFVAENAAVYLSCREDEKPVDLLSDSKVDIAFLDSTELPDAKAAGLSMEQLPNICWVMTVSKDYSADVRSSFAKLVSADIYASALPDGFSPASSIYPEIIAEGKQLSGVGVTAYDLAGAQELFSNAVKSMENKRFPSATLTYYDDPAIKDTVTALVGHWQQKLSAFINIEASASLNGFTSQLINPTMSFAVFPIRAANANAAEYLLNFGVNSGDASAVQKQLLATNNLIPIAYENSIIATAETVERIVFSKDNGYVDFSFIIKKG